jgi:hypothetical protein
MSTDNEPSEKLPLFRLNCIIASASVGRGFLVGEIECAKIIDLKHQPMLKI